MNEEENEEENGFSVSTAMGSRADDGGGENKC